MEPTTAAYDVKYFGNEAMSYCKRVNEAPGVDSDTYVHATHLLNVRTGDGKRTLGHPLTHVLLEMATLND